MSKKELYCWKDKFLRQFLIHRVETAT